MSKQFENPEETNVADQTVVHETEQETIDRLAEDAAVKATKSEQKYDKDHKLFTI